MSPQFKFRHVQKLAAVIVALSMAMLVAGLTAVRFGDTLIGVAAGALALPLALVMLRPMLEDRPRSRGI